MRAFSRGLFVSLSIAAGYLPIAFSFGLAALQAGLSPLTTLMLSVVVYAGASQFVLIPLLASGAGLLTALPTVLLMNARHLFYGPSLWGKYRRPADGNLPTSVLAFGLTDEVFAASMTRMADVPEAQRERWYLGLQTGAYASWVLGTVLGVALGGYFEHPPVALQAALSFILPGLFFALLLEIGVLKNWRVVVITACACVLLLLWLPGYHALALGMLLGAASGLVPTRRSQEPA
ncbi:AzlC family ABC transporter permease [Pseudomonas sp. S 311-6]|uniref:AzlC family ABC transporter permease n=1 Tax=Kerstersia gyiorum TaxID=206506 RepID=UPI00107158D2|nr:AzlC family ABC transporter permease [Kerstersia gyiorum]MCO7636497.1 AzlC family ABC transporter permease [Pseudomonas sp. S 311-6]QBR40342.1 branched-chain amino acid ABC transporter permease [Kerstersia gyiorum]